MTRPTHVGAWSMGLLLGEPFEYYCCLLYMCIVYHQSYRCLSLHQASMLYIFLFLRWQRVLFIVVLRKPRKVIIHSRDCFSSFPPFYKALSIHSTILQDISYHSQSVGYRYTLKVAVTFIARLVHRTSIPNVHIVCLRAVFPNVHYYALMYTLASVDSPCSDGPDYYGKPRVSKL